MFDNYLLFVNYNLNFHPLKSGLVLNIKYMCLAKYLYLIIFWSCILLRGNFVRKYYEVSLII